MNYREALEYVEAELKGGCNPGLKRIKRLLELLGNPHKELKAIHIAGTNGKGSVSAMISSILKESKYKVGTYISPHLIDYRERYSVNGIMISESRFTKYTELLKDKIEYMKSRKEEIPSQFEMLTALAFLYMRDEKVDVVVIEVGLGGRYDATNVVDSMISVITSISYDHMGILGESIKEIAFEKAGIIKKNGLTILYPQKHIEAENVVGAVCRELNNKLIKVKADVVIPKKFGIDGQIFDYYYEDNKYNDIKLPLLGDHQLLNAAVAITTAVSLADFGFKIDKNDLLKGIENTRWPGRLSIVSNDPLIIIDGAHNSDGVSALSDALKKYFRGKELILVMGMLKDKEYSKSIEILSPMANIFIATQPLSERALSAEEVGREAKKYCSNVMIEPSLADAINKANNMYNSNSVICISGSLYLSGEAYKIITKGVFKTL